MRQGEAFICDFCKEPIGGHRVIEVQRFVLVDENYECTGNDVKYFHLDNDQRSKGYSKGGCYQSWAKSPDSYSPHAAQNIRKITILEGLVLNG